MEDATRPQHPDVPTDLIEGVLDALDDRTRADLLSVRRREGNNHDVVELRFEDGRTLIVKRASHDWAAPRFDASRRAARMLRRRAGVIAPQHLPLTVRIGGRPVQAYWRIALPTLEALWGGLSADERVRALRGWGALVRRVHGIRLGRCGPIGDRPAAQPSLEAFFTRDLADRLLPAVTAVWPDGRPVVERLTAAVPAVAAVADGPAYPLVHNDLHMGNVLCDVRDDRVRCVGLLDLEAAMAAPAEADLASAAVLHGPGFGHPLRGPWFARLCEGYGSGPNPLLLRFFRSYHLVNMGFYSALVGRDRHAERVVRLAGAAVDRVHAAAYAGG